MGAQKKQDEQPVPEEGAALPSAPEPAPRVYPVRRLIEEAEVILGVRRHTAAGGLNGAEGEMTIAEAKARIEAYLARPAA